MPALLSRRWWRSVAAAALSILVLAACGAPAPGRAAAKGSATAAAPPQPASPIAVFAAASLTAAFNEIGAQFTSETGIPVVFNFAGSQQLRGQLEQGADADVFASANRKEMTAAVDSGLVGGGSEKIFARNRLVVIYPKANPGGIQALPDLAKPGLKLVVADKAVPVGQYSLELFDKMSKDPAFGADFAARVLKNVVSYEQNVKAVVSKVQLGEADAGVVYATDVTGDAREKVSALEVPDAFNQAAEYPLAVLAQSKQPASAARFAAYVLSDAGQAILARHGFLAPEER